jgi:hypothetical protein
MLVKSTARAGRWRRCPSQLSIAAPSAGASIETVAVPQAEQGSRRGFEISVRESVVPELV